MPHSRHLSRDPVPTSMVTEEDVSVADMADSLRAAAGWAKDETSAATESFTVRAMMQGMSIMNGWIHHKPRKLEELPVWRQHLIKAVHSLWFQLVASMVVVVNIILMGVQTSMDMKRALAGEDELNWEAASDVFFACAFGIEVGLRIIAEHRVFFLGPARYWNIFDFFVVVFAVFDAFDAGFSLNIFRALRVFRMIKIARVIRVFTFFRELRLMAVSLISCLSSLSWAVCFIMLIMYLFGMVLLEGARVYARDNPSDDPVCVALEEFYSDVPWTIYSLLMTITGGKDWYDLAKPFEEISRWYCLGFCAFVFFVQIGMLNVLTGVFVQRAEEIAHVDHDLVIQEETAKKNTYLKQIQNLFTEVDTDGSGTVSWEELKTNLLDERVLTYFSLLQIDIAEAKGLFQLLDVDASGSVGIDEFVMGCMRLKGAARSIDLAHMLYENKRMSMKWKAFMTLTRNQLSAVMDGVLALQIQSRSLQMTGRQEAAVG